MACVLLGVPAVLQCWCGARLARMAGWNESLSLECSKIVTPPQPTIKRTPTNYNWGRVVWVQAVTASTTMTEDCSTSTVTEPSHPHPPTPQPIHNKNCGDTYRSDCEPIFHHGYVLCYRRESYRQNFVLQLFDCILSHKELWNRPDCLLSEPTMPPTQVQLKQIMLTITKWGFVSLAAPRRKGRVQEGRYNTCKWTCYWVSIFPPLFVT